MASNISNRRRYEHSVLLRGSFTGEPEEAAAAVMAGLAAAATLFADRSELDAIRHSHVRQDRLALNLLFGLASGTTEPLGGLDAMEDGIESLLASADHTPFDGRDLDCGLAGERVDIEANVRTYLVLRDGGYVALRRPSDLIGP